MQEITVLKKVYTTRRRDKRWLLERTTIKSLESLKPPPLKKSRKDTENLQCNTILVCDHNFALFLTTSDKMRSATAEQQEEAEKKMKDIGEAYEVLSDVEKKGKYDRFVIF